ncbi:MAG: glutamate 5-kinase [Candidatus Bruticola sp.]
MRDTLRNAKIWIIKVGTRVCVDGYGRLNGKIMLGLATQIQKLREQGSKICLVSSGAIGMGRELMRLEGCGENLPLKQALAAMGQVEIMNSYKNLFAMLGIKVGQVLLTRDDIAARDRYLNARNALNALLDYGILPIINENDSVSTGEIRFGDNDSLAAMVGSIVNSDVVVNLTSVPGILAGVGAEEHVIEHISEITPEIESLDRGTTTKGGTGGLASKLRAAKMVMRYGGAMVIASASEENVLLRLASGESLGTLFEGAENRLNSRQRWLAEAARSEGTVIIDKGAAEALAGGGSSLLAVGCIGCSGHFQAGDLVTIVVQGREGVPFARGLSNYSSGELNLIAGRPNSEAASILGHPAYADVVHCDNMIIG